MTAEEYVIDRLTKTEKELAELKKEYEDMTKRVEHLIGENRRLGEKFGFIAETLNPKIKVYGGSRSIDFDDVADWVKGGESKVNRMIEIFGLKETDSNA